MKPLFIPFLVGALIAAAATTSGAQQPLPDDLELPMPGGSTMVFRPVYLNVGGGPFAQRTVKIGGGDNFRENPTSVQLGGAFLKDHKGKQDWLYYIGKLEVTAGQYAAIMGQPAPPAADANLPVVSISWLETQQFIEKFNAWLVLNAKGSIPARDGMQGYVRLPTEAEWEFAARGGTEVDAGQFERRIPYAQQDLVNHEWFSGARSSHDKLKKAGLLGPNPLGIHDMLGNAAEWVEGLYQIEYVQARPGGHIVRGGSFRTPEVELRSSSRTEQPLSDAKGSPAKSDDIGFRLVISAPVFTGLNALRQMKEAWADYLKERTAPLSAPLATAPAVVQTQMGVADAGEQLTRHIDSVKSASSQKESLEELNRLRASLADVQSLMMRADKEMAAGGVFQATDAVYRVIRNLYLIEADDEDAPGDIARGKTADERMKIADELKERKAGFQQAIKWTRAQLAHALDVLLTVQPETAHKEFDAYIGTLREHGDGQETLAAERTRAIYLDYHETRRLRMDEWQEGLRKDALDWLSDK